MHPFSVWVHDPEFHAKGEFVETAACDYQRQAILIAKAEAELKPVVSVNVYKLMGPGVYRLDYRYEGRRGLGLAPEAAPS